VRVNNDNNHYSEPVPPVNQSPTVKDKWQELNEQLQADVDDIGFIDNQTGNLIAENCQRWEATVKVLNKAKKEGVIEEYKEIASGVYEIKLPGTLIWENRAFHEIEIYHQLRRWRDMSYSVN